LKLTFSFYTAQEHGLISLYPDKLASKDATLENISDLGKLKGEKIKLDIDKTKIPQIDNRVEDTIAKCTTCQAVGQANPPEPLRMTEMPELPRRTVHLGF
jgi:hypothetical protein